MTEICDDCGLLFSRIFKARRCPLCGGPRVRPATAEEKETRSIETKKGLPQEKRANEAATRHEK